MLVYITYLISLISISQAAIECHTCYDLESSSLVERNNSDVRDMIRDMLGLGEAAGACNSDPSNTPTESCETACVTATLRADLSKYNGYEFMKNVQDLGQATLLFRGCLDDTPVSPDIFDKYIPLGTEEPCADIDGAGWGAQLKGKACVCRTNKCNVDSLDVELPTDSPISNIIASEPFNYHNCSGLDYNKGKFTFLGEMIDQYSKFIENQTKIPFGRDCLFEQTTSATPGCDTLAWVAGFSLDLSGYKGVSIEIDQIDEIFILKPETIQALGRVGAMSRGCLDRVVPIKADYPSILPEDNLCVNIRASLLGVEFVEKVCACNKAGCNRAGMEQFLGVAPNPAPVEPEEPPKTAAAESFQCRSCYELALEDSDLEADTLEFLQNGSGLVLPTKSDLCSTDASNVPFVSCQIACVSAEFSVDLNQYSGPLIGEEDLNLSKYKSGMLTVRDCAERLMEAKQDDIDSVKQYVTLDPVKPACVTVAGGGFGGKLAGSICACASDDCNAEAIVPVPLPESTTSTDPFTAPFPYYNCSGISYNSERIFFLREVIGVQLDKLESKSATPIRDSCFETPNVPENQCETMSWIVGTQMDVSQYSGKDLVFLSEAIPFTKNVISAFGNVKAISRGCTDNKFSLRADDIPADMPQGELCVTIEANEVMGIKGAIKGCVCNKNSCNGIQFTPFLGKKQAETTTTTTTTEKTTTTTVTPAKTQHVDTNANKESTNSPNEEPGTNPDEEAKTNPDEEAKTNPDEEAKTNPDEEPEKGPDEELKTQATTPKPNPSPKEKVELFPLEENQNGDSGKSGIGTGVLWLVICFASLHLFF